MSQTLGCWCGNAQLEKFNDDYNRCPACETLVTARTPAQPVPVVTNDEDDFYGRNYWFKHQEQDLGFGNIESRARTDLPERCQHWLQSLLRFKLPPARVLEMGCAHGGFVAMLRAAGYDSAGLELSPAIVDLARRTFDVPMYLGPLEQQSIEPGSLDVIAMMDVMEHLPDPLGTITRCGQLLKPDGVLVVQTPRYPEGKSYQAMLDTNDPFIEQLKSNEHIYLFSERSAAELFQRAGLGYCAKQPAMFAIYDMFLFASASPLAPRGDGDIDAVLLSSAQGRILLCELEKSREILRLRERIAVIDKDREERLSKIFALTAEVKRLHSQVEIIEADRADRLVNITTLTSEVRQLQSRLSEFENLRSGAVQP